MNFSAVNFLAVLVAAVANLLLGFLWYGPLFSKPWMKLMGMTRESMQQGGQSPIIYAVPFIGSLVTSYALALFINATGMGTAMGGAGVGLLAGLGFLAPAMGANALFGQKKFALYLIDTGYPIVSLIIAGVILGAWR